MFPYQVYLFHLTRAHLFNLRGNDAALIRRLVVLLSPVLWDIRGPLMRPFGFTASPVFLRDLPGRPSAGGAKPEDDRCFSPIGFVKLSAAPAGGL